MSFVFLICQVASARKLLTNKRSSNEASTLITLKAKEFQVTYPRTQAKSWFYTVF